VKLLVTGASGLLGTKLCELALQSKHEVYSVYGEHKPIYGKAFRLDVSSKVDVESAFEKIRPEAVVHAAALTDVDKCELEREKAWRINVLGTENVAESCRRCRAFLVYISTDYVFDGEKGIYQESDATVPINYYGFTKLRAEESAKNLVNACCVARASVIFGSNPATGKMNFALWLIGKLRKREKVEVVTDQWNSPTLNTSLARMILEAVEREMTGTYHLSGATRVDRYSFSKLVAETFDLDAGLITPILSGQFSWVARRPRDSSLNTDKAEKAFRSKPLKLETALLKMKEEMQ
jgi:dTDP-4-dehydrorhamnose reductase